MTIHGWLRCLVISAGIILVIATPGVSESFGSSTAAVDVNRATVAELMTVPGMTEVWAKRIVRFRPYRRKTDLVDRGVVSAEEYGKIRDYLIAHRVTDEKDKQASVQ